jgi:hypothetical protein
MTQLPRFADPRLSQDTRWNLYFIGRIATIYLWKQTTETKTTTEKRYKRKIQKEILKKDYQNVLDSLAILLEIEV